MGFMKSSVVVCSVVLGALSLGTAQGQETPQMRLEFVRNLRAKGYHDLAQEQLTLLSKAAPADIQAILPLENARLLLAIARDKEPEQRASWFQQARQELEGFVKANAGKPAAAQARLEIARLMTYQGETTLNRALREEDPAVRQEQASQAEQQFQEAGKVLAAAAKELKGEDQVQAEVDQAVMLINRARCFLDTEKEAILRKRTALIQEAQKAFESIVTNQEGAQQILAAAWLIRCYQETDDPQNATKMYGRVMLQTGKEAIPAQRWARYFWLQGIPTNTTIKLDALGRVEAQQKLAREWIKLYPSALKSQVGQGVQFELANALYREAEIRGKKDPKNAVVKDLYDEAEKLFEKIAAGDSDFAEEANKLSVSIAIRRMGEGTDIDDLTDFRECFLKAQVEMYKMRKLSVAPDAPKEKIEAAEKERKEHLRSAIRALKRGISLADTRTPVHKLDDARYLLTTAYLVSGDLYRAAVSGDALGRTRPPTRRAPAAAGYAIEAYASLAQRDDSEGLRRRLEDLADYVLQPDMQKLWSGEPVTGVARYQLAMLAKKDGDVKKTIEHLSKLPREFGGYLYAQGQLVFIALEARDKTDDSKAKEAYQEQALQAIQRMPDLPEDADPSTTAMYFHAQLELPKFLYAEAAPLLKKELPKAAAKYAEMGKVLQGLQARFDKLPGKAMSEETRDKLGFFLGVLSKYATLGQADIEYRKGNYDKVLSKDLTAPVVALVGKLGAKVKGDIKMKDYQVTGEILGLALRAQVQKGNIPEAKAVLRNLERLTGEEEGLLVETTNVLRNLVTDLQIQVQELKKAKNEKKLQGVVDNFSKFLDELIPKDGKGKSLQAGDLAFLANCYISLERWCKAAELYSKVPEPKFLNDKLPRGADILKLTDPKEKDRLEKQERELQTYWYIQVQQAKALRMCFQEDKNKEKLEKANKVIETLLNHPNARQQMRAEKEKIHLLEESGLFGTAINGWGGFLKNPSLKSQLNDPNIKEMYFEAYYHYGYCIYKYGQTDAAKAKGLDKRYTTYAANHLLRLKNSPNPEGWNIVGPQVEALLQREEPLRAEFAKLDKTKS